MTKQPCKLSPQILDEASAWFTEFTAGGLDAVVQAEFNSWMRRSPEHVQAYLQIAAFWEDADLLNAPLGRDLDGLIARARQETNVHPLERARADGTSLPTTSSATHALPENGPGSRRRSILALAASVTVLLAGTVWLHWQRGVYSTEVGEQRSITLDDGSAVELNARSRLRVRFNEGQRSVELVAGQALFHVAKDPNRPFVVQSGETRVRAVGTQFDVYRKLNGTVITVVEGRVAVAVPPAQSTSVSRKTPTGTSNDRDEVLLRAGEQLVVGSGAPARIEAERKPHRTNVAVATAWTQKRLVFDGTPLREVVEEFNRYNRRQLVIRDPSLYEFHVSGAFPSTDSARMLDILRRRFGVVLKESGDKIEILGPQNL
jgi:transmembrane sensor